MSVQVGLRCQYGTATRAVELAIKFLQLFFRGMIDEAHQCTHEQFVWFGMTNLDWEGPALRSFVGSKGTNVEKVRLLPRPWLMLLSPQEQTTLFGVLEDSDHVVMAHVRHGEQHLTIALVVAGDGKRVLRVADAVPFKQAMLRIRNAADSEHGNPAKVPNRGAGDPKR